MEQLVAYKPLSLMIPEGLQENMKAVCRARELTISEYVRALGSEDALIHMKGDLTEAERERGQNKILREKLERQRQTEDKQRLMKLIQDSKKSTAEKAGEYYGSAKSGFAKAWTDFTEPVRSIARDFEKGSSKTK